MRPVASPTAAEVSQSGSHGVGIGLSPRDPSVMFSRLSSTTRVTSPKPSVTMAR